jgi:hypothetical protein
MIYDATQKAAELGLYFQDYNAQMALQGSLIGWAIFGLVNFLAFQVSAKKGGK